jgi:hypothetical protein
MSGDRNAGLLSMNDRISEHFGPAQALVGPASSLWFVIAAYQGLRANAFTR